MPFLETGFILKFCYCSCALRLRNLRIGRIRIITNCVVIRFHVCCCTSLPDPSDMRIEVLAHFRASTSYFCFLDYLVTRVRRPERISIELFTKIDILGLFESRQDRLCVNRQERFPM